MKSYGVTCKLHNNATCDYRHGLYVCENCGSQLCINHFGGDENHLCRACQAQDGAYHNRAEELYDMYRDRTLLDIMGNALSAGFDVYTNTHLTRVIVCDGKVCVTLYFLDTLKKCKVGFYTMGNTETLISPRENRDIIALTYQRSQEYEDYLLTNRPYYDDNGHWYAPCNIAGVDYMVRAWSDPRSYIPEKGWKICWE